MKKIQKNIPVQPKIGQKYRVQCWTLTTLATENAKIIAAPPCLSEPSTTIRYSLREILSWAPHFSFAPRLFFFSWPITPLTIKWLTWCTDIGPKIFSFLLSSRDIFGYATILWSPHLNFGQSFNLLEYFGRHFGSNLQKLLTCPNTRLFFLYQRDQWTNFYWEPFMCRNPLF